MTTICKMEIRNVHVLWPYSPFQLASSITDEAHLWCASVSDFIVDLAAFEALLSDDEKARARRFRFKRDHDQYVVAKGILRILLQQYCGRDAAKVQFLYSAEGRPSLLPTPKYGHIHFNVSHSGDLILFAFSRNCMQIGVDIERIRPLPDLDQMAAKFLSAREYREFSALEEAQKQAGFFNCWTRKEAIVKAIGKGLAFGMERLDVSLAPGAPVQVISIAGSLEEAAKWTLHSISPAFDFYAALAMRTSLANVQCWRVPPLSTL